MAQPLQPKPTPPEPAPDQFPPDESPDGVDLTLIRWTLSLTPLERIDHEAKTGLNDAGPVLVGERGQSG